MIAAIYGFEEANAKRFLVLELVEGPTLADRLANGRLPVEESLDIARQITEALEVAHETGIIHRDLKPANIKVTPDGQVKVLDFGLAKALTEENPSGDPADSPTITKDFTRPGVILGTAAYMSPEQARGKEIDKQTDIWAVGCVLFELLTGRPAFNGDSISDLLASVLVADPEWNSLPSETPPEISRLLRRLLHKDKSRRLRDVGDARIELTEALAEPRVKQSVPNAPQARLLKWRSFIPWLITACAVCLAGVIYHRASKIGAVGDNQQRHIADRFGGSRKRLKKVLPQNAVQTLAYARWQTSLA